MNIRFKQQKQVHPDLQYPEVSERDYLSLLRETYKLETIIDPNNSDFQNILKIQSWVHSRWEQDNIAEPVKKDAMFILKQAEAGKRFRCAEYSTVSKACLQALGFTVRKLWLRSRDEEILSRNASHVMNEIYLKDLKKWFFMDPCFDIMIKKDGIPLNAVELLLAMINEDELEVINPSNEITCDEYLEKIGPFLFYFSTRLNSKTAGILKCIGITEKQLTLVPVEEDTHTLFKKHIWNKGDLVTNSIADFYPNLNAE